MMQSDYQEKLRRISKLMRRWILTTTAQAGSGHPTSAMSAVELMAGLFFGGHFRFDVDNPDHPNNDRLIFFKGHASPLLYALWAATGQISEDELMTYRDFNSRLEGHPTSRFRYTEAATGSLGQGLSIGVGMALNAKRLDQSTGLVLTVEDHYAEGGLGEAVRSALADTDATVRSLAVRKRPRSGTPNELLVDQGLSAGGIVAEIRQILASGLRNRGRLGCN